MQIGGEYQSHKWEYHGIDQHASELTRYSLAINIVPVGSYGDPNDSVYDTSWY